MTRVIGDTARPIRLSRIAAGIWMSALLALAAPPVSAQSQDAPQRSIDIAVTDLALPGTFQVLIDDRGLVFGSDSSSGLNFLLDTRTGAYDASLPSFDPFDMNERGEVVGIFDAPRSAGGTQGAFWTKEHGRRLSSTFLARGINKHGDMAGNCIVGIDQIGPPCVLIRAPHDDFDSGVIHVIDAGADSAGLVAINDHGVAAGNASYADGSVRAFTWSLTDGVTFLEAPSSASSSATAINNHGQIAGAIQSEGAGHPAMWSAESGAIGAELRNLNGSASGINDHGVLLVTAVDDQTGRFDYAVWIPGRDIFAELPPADPTAAGVFASDINNRGQIIGNQYHVGADGTVASSELIMWQIAIRGVNR